MRNIRLLCFGIATAAALVASLLLFHPPVPAHPVGGMKPSRSLLSMVDHCSPLASLATVLPSKRERGAAFIGVLVVATLLSYLLQLSKRFDTSSVYRPPEILLYSYRFRI